MFKGNADIVFGDVALSSDQVQTIHGESQGAGAGGWPTVRMFNKETGYGGKAYKQKTSEAMCDELGPKNDYMQQLVEEYATLCNIIDTSTGCSDKQKEFITKWGEKPVDEIKKQHTRLTGMTGGSMKPEAMQWLKQRIGLYKQLGKKHGEEL
jgi:hypothetical protein